MAKSRSATRKTKAKKSARKALKVAKKAARRAVKKAVKKAAKRFAKKETAAKAKRRPSAKVVKPAKVAKKPARKAAAPLVALVTVPAAAPAQTPATAHDALVAGETEVSAAKFAFAQPAELKVLDERERAQSIPWGYGRDKVTAMAVDPERLFIYWEVTDGAIERARNDLGRSGDDTWLALRVHDVTGLLFDGSNAHHAFDIGVARGDRQWFVQIGRPTSEVIVELGLLARDGRFAPIARSKRVEFPRREPAPAGPVEWLDVRPVAHGGDRPQLQVNRAVTHGPGSPGWDTRNDRPWDGGDGAGNHEWRDARGAFWVAGAPWSSAAPADFVKSFGASAGSFWHEWATASSHTLQWSGGASRWQWVGPLLEERWESGPIPVEVALRDLPEVTVEQRGGDVTFQSWRGLTRVQYGPWSVAIRGLAARAGRRVLARWEVKKSWVVAEGVERFGIVAWTTKQMARRGGPGGASEELGASEALFAGASERRMLAGSELRLGGGSELFWLGASELNYGGVGARAFGGASERQMAGASEMQFRGASELQFAGASEARFQGASEARLGGASEERLGGASEASLLPTLTSPSAP